MFYKINKALINFEQVTYIEKTFVDGRKCFCIYLTDKTNIEIPKNKMNQKSDYYRIKKIMNSCDSEGFINLKK